MADKPKSHDDESLNFDKLEKELNAAVNADQRYWRENDAKFRAVHQKVATYEEFKDIVKASHIKPLEKGDKMDSIVFNQPWNIAAAKKLKRRGQNEDGRNSSEQEYSKEWTRVCAILEKIFEVCRRPIYLPSKYRWRELVKYF